MISEEIPDGCIIVLLLDYTYIACSHNQPDVSEKQRILFTIDILNPFPIQIETTSSERCHYGKSTGVEKKVSGFLKDRAGTAVKFC